VTAKPLHLLIPQISPAASGTLYEQLVTGVKRAIGEGRLKAGDPLPSFRQLAEQMLVSVITVKRAYEELEREGIIYRRQGLGTFVAEGGTDRTRDSKLTRARELLAEGVKEAAEAGLKAPEIRRLFTTILKPES
jgi:GntR family transcriptional regulator